MPWLVGATAAILMVWPWPLAPHWMIGAESGEADKHLWMWWWTVQKALGGGVVADWPYGCDWALLDLVHFPPALLLVDLHASLAYGVVALGDVALALAAGWFLSREAGASPAGALVGMVCLGSAPYLAGVLVVGMTEAWPIGWYGLHLAAWLRFARTGSRGSALAAVLTLAAFAISGPYHAFFAALAAPLLLLWAWRGRGADRRRLAVLTGVGLAAVVLALPYVWWLLDSSLTGGVASREAVLHPSTLRGLNYGGADLVGLVRPRLSTDPLPKATYIGLVALALGVVAAWRRPQARWAAIGCLLFLILALGPILSVSEALPFGATVRLPAAWLTTAAPVLRMVRDWYRAVGMAQVFLAPMAALGATVLLRGRPAYQGVLAAACVLLDALLLSGAAWPRPVYDARPPEGLAELPGKGPMVVLPFDRGEGVWPPGAATPYLRWQVWWDRPLSEVMARHSRLVEDPVFGWLDRECSRRGQADPLRQEVRRLPPPTLSQVEQSVSRLVDQGLELIVVVRPRLPVRSSCEYRIASMLGEPDATGPLVAWWWMQPGRPPGR
ncbi:MAG: hypothetical protein JXB39_01350 [Deltaproteobacteria bacterium]|nr:hypothetical protein [Deltaproteobacteria bacterium]